MTSFPVPRYGEASLADVGPSLLAALGVEGETDTLGLGELQRAVLFVVDGLGWQQLQAERDVAPYLASMTGRALTAGFPATTVSSLASIGTGLPSGQHAMTGYSSYVEEVGSVVNWLAWRPVGEGGDIRDRLVPEVVQPQPTVWERADRAGVATTICTFDNFAETGLTRAVLRGGRWGGTYAEGDAVARAAEASDRGHRSLVYVYVSALDLVGHMRGPDTDAWRGQLAIVDRIAAELSRRLPPEAALFVTADHGMVFVPDEAKVDADELPSLRDGVVALAGEPRARYVHVAPGAVDDVQATWREVLGDGWEVVRRDDAIAAGLFGPVVSTAARERIGDLIALSLGNGGVVERRRTPRLSAMPGQHGSVTDDELLVPLLRSIAG
ncbi:MAG TPA: nucleotide pyrophosphatase/phosphodiesterase family protein [Mycobacteriales bacterium]|nr:nucleotide pyrophosphatase/phosphodiesterase family protein [Mycobacteriales bacterium]